MKDNRESAFQSKVMKWLNNYCYCVKFNASGISKSGVPDILCCIKGHFVGLELKTDIGTPSPLQLFNIGDIIKNDGIGVILKPKIWNDFKDITLNFIEDTIDYTEYKNKLLELEKSVK